MTISIHMWRIRFPSRMRVPSRHYRVYECAQNRKMFRPEQRVKAQTYRFLFSFFFFGVGCLNDFAVFSIFETMVTKRCASYLRMYEVFSRIFILVNFREPIHKSSETLTTSRQSAILYRERPNSFPCIVVWSVNMATNRIIARQAFSNRLNLLFPLKLMHEINEWK